MEELHYCYLIRDVKCLLKLNLECILTLIIFYLMKALFDKTVVHNQVALN